MQLDGLFHLLGGKWKQHNVYDPGSDEWSKAAPMPVKVNRVQAVTVGGKIYMIGGMVKWKAPTIESRAVLIYARARTHEPGHADAASTRGGGIAVFGGKIYYAGGIADSRSVKWFDVYNPATNKWRKLPNMPTARQHFQAAVVNGKFFAFGGANYATRQLVKKSVRFNFQTGNWRKKGVRKPLVLTEGSLPQTRRQGRALRRCRRDRRQVGGAGIRPAHRQMGEVGAAPHPTPRHASRDVPRRGVHRRRVGCHRTPSPRSAGRVLPGAPNPC